MPASTSRSSSGASRIRPPLLAENWAERQQTLAELGSAGTWAALVVGIDFTSATGHGWLA